MNDTGNERSKAAALHGFSRGQRKRPHSAPVKCAQESDELIPAGVITGELDSAFDGLRPGIAERDSPLQAAWRHRGQLLRHLYEILVIEIGAGHVNQTGRLLLDRFDNPRMAVPRGYNRNACVEIQKRIAVHIFNDCALTTLGDERISPRIGRRNKTAVPRNYVASPRAW